MKGRSIFVLLMLIVLTVGCCSITAEPGPMGVVVEVTNDNVTTPLISFVVAEEEEPAVNASMYYQTGSFDPVRPNEEDWVCYDYSINYARENPEWGIVTMSGNSAFRGISHMVNYKIVDSVMYIHDEMNGYNCYFRFDERTTDNPYYNQTYYKFYGVNETPERVYKVMVDNSETFFTGS